MSSTRWVCAQVSKAGIFTRGLGLLVATGKKELQQLPRIQNWAFCTFSFLEILGEGERQKWRGFLDDAGVS